MRSKTFARFLRHNCGMLLKREKVFKKDVTFSDLPVCCTLSKVMTRATFKSYEGRIWPMGPRFPTPGVDQVSEMVKK